MVAEVEELNNIGAGDGEARVALVLEDGETRGGQVNGGFQFRELQLPS